MITCTPSFLALPEWQATIYHQQNPHDDYNSYCQSLKALNRRVGDVSILLCEIKSLTSRIIDNIHTDADIKVIIRHYDDLRGKVQEHLDRDNLIPYTGADHGRGYIILAKQYLLLWKMDMHLFEMLYLLVPYDDPHSASYLDQIILTPSSTTLPRPDLPVYQTVQNVTSHSRILNHLDHSISHSGKAIKEFMLLLKLVNPFSTRKMAFLWQTLCAEAKKGGGVHRAWDDMETWLGVMNQRGCLF